MPEREEAIRKFGEENYILGITAGCGGFLGALNEFAKQEQKSSFTMAELTSMVPSFSKIFIDSFVERWENERTTRTTVRMMQDVDQEATEGKE